MAWPAKRDKKGHCVDLYEPKMCARIVAYGQKGYHDHQIASRLGVSRQSLWKWCKTYPACKEALNTARCHATALVMDATLRNIENRWFNPKCAELLLKIHNDVEDAYVRGLPNLKTEPTIAGKAHVIINALAERRLSPENAKTMMETLKSLVTIEQEVEVVPALKALEQQIELLEHKK